MLSTDKIRLIAAKEIQYKSDIHWGISVIYLLETNIARLQMQTKRTETDWRKLLRGKAFLYICKISKSFLNHFFLENLLLSFD